MYGLKQANILAYNHIKTNLKPYGYHLKIVIVGFWKYESRPIYFCLCADDFRIQYYNKAGVDHLLDEIGKSTIIPRIGMVSIIVV